MVTRATVYDRPPPVRTRGYCTSPARYLLQTILFRDENEERLNAVPSKTGRAGSYGFLRRTCSRQSTDDRRGEYFIQTFMYPSTRYWFCLVKFTCA